MLRPISSLAVWLHCVLYAIRLALRRLQSVSAQMHTKNKGGRNGQFEFRDHESTLFWSAAGTMSHGCSCMLTVSSLKWKKTTS